MLLSQIYTLFQSECRAEKRKRKTLAGLILYLLSTVFLIYQLNKTIDNNLFIALYWIILLFISVNAAYQTFIGENKNTMLYWYSTVKSVDFLMAKYIYASFKIVCLSLLNFGLLYIFYDNAKDFFSLSFICIALLGSICMVVLFTFISFLSFISNQDESMAAVLGFPLSIPLLMLTVKVSTLEQQILWVYLLFYLIYLILIIALSLILVSFLWKE
ncbi:MAG: hypothetical protein ACRC0A_06340 [Chitinophagaceae bacterium]